MMQDVSIQLSSRARFAAGFLVGLGVITAVYGIMVAPERTWPNLLLNGFYIASVGVSAMFFLATQRVTGARWSASLRRVPEAYISVLPASAVLIVVVFFGRQLLYPWTHAGGMAGEPAFAGKLRYLQPQWVYTRAVIVFAVWLIFAWMFRRTSR